MILYPLSAHLFKALYSILSVTKITYISKNFHLETSPFYQQKVVVLESKDVKHFGTTWTKSKEKIS